MRLEKQEIFEYKNDRYIVVCEFITEGKQYYFVNKLNKETDEITEDYYIFREMNNNVEMLENAEEANNILPMAQEKLKEEIKIFLEGDE